MTTDTYFKFGTFAPRERPDMIGEKIKLIVAAFLFSLLARHRARVVKQHHLCNIPLTMWLWWLHAINANDVISVNYSAGCGRVSAVHQLGVVLVAVDSKHKQPKSSLRLHRHNQSIYQSQGLSSRAISRLNR